MSNACKGCPVAFDAPFCGKTMSKPERSGDFLPLPAAARPPVLRADLPLFPAEQAFPPPGDYVMYFRSRYTPTDAVGVRKIRRALVKMS